MGSDVAAVAAEIYLMMKKYLAEVVARSLPVECATNHVVVDGGYNNFVPSHVWTFQSSNLR